MLKAGSCGCRWLVTLGLMALSLAGCDNQSEHVQATWDRYVAATVAKDGPGAVAVLNGDTIGYYETVRSHALNSDATTVRALPFVQKMMVLLTRANVDPAYLNTLNGSQLLMVGIRDGWMSSTGDPKSMTLENIKVDGEVATGELVMQGKSPGLPCKFTKEEGGWKLDLTSMIGFLESNLRTQLSRRGSSGPSIDDMLPLIIGQQSGKQIGPEIWDKPKIK